MRLGTCYGAATGSLSFPGNQSIPSYNNREGQSTSDTLSLSSFLDFTELQLNMTNCQIHLPFCQINPWRVGRLPLDFVFSCFSAGHGHMLLLPSSHQLSDISGTLPAFYHHPFICVWLRFCSSPVAIDVIHNQQKVGMLLWVLSLGL